jgi:hypothetical protein
MIHGPPPKNCPTNGVHLSSGRAVVQARLGLFCLMALEAGPERDRPHIVDDFRRRRERLVEVAHQFNALRATPSERHQVIRPLFDSLHLSTSYRQVAGDQSRYYAGDPVSRHSYQLDLRLSSGRRSRRQQS